MSGPRAKIRLIGLPTDSHSSFLRGAAQAPGAIRKALSSDHSNMTRDPKMMAPDDLIDDALALFDEFRITSLFVVEDDGSGKKPLGVLHIHDCPAAR